MKPTPITAVALSLALSAFTASAGPVTVANVTASQQPGQPLVDIAYALLNPSGGMHTVAIDVSTNSGATYVVGSTNCSGAVGAGVTTGTLKQVVWFAAGDFPLIITSQAHVRVTASETPAATNGMALIPAGPFVMGNCMNASEGYSDELPVHTVMVSAFYMDKHEVTSQQWFEVRNWALANGYTFDNPGSGKGATHPAQEVNWYDCVKWCNARSQKEGLTPCYYTSAVQTQIYRIDWIDLSSDCVNWSANGYRLPTEAEWEKAARGGASGHRFPWSQCDTITFTNANYWSYWSGGVPYYSYDKATQSGYNSTFATGGTPYTSPVGYFAANGYGLYDMAGNVWEWCWDWYDGGWYRSGSETQTDTSGPSSGSYRLVRGGSWTATRTTAAWRPATTTRRTSRSPTSASGLCVVEVSVSRVLAGASGAAPAGRPAVWFCSGGAAGRRAAK